MPTRKLGGHEGAEGHNEERNRYVRREAVPHDRALVEELLVHLLALAVKKARTVLPREGRRADGQQQHKNDALKAKDGAHG